MDPSRGTGIDEHLARLGIRQHGLVRRDQALERGCTPRMLAHRLAEGRLVRVEPKVYRLAGVPETWRQRVLSACWAEDGLAYGRTAAALYGLDGFASAVVEVVVPRGRRRANPSLRVHESRDLVPADRGERDRIPVTRIERTLIDLAAVVPPAKVEQGLDDALRRGLTTAEAVHARLLGLARRGRPGVATVRPLVESRLASTGLRPGEFERRVERVLIAAGLATPVCEYEIRTAAGVLIGRVDLAYPWARVVIECDSERWHSGRQRRQRDLERQNALVLAGWTVLRFTWADLTQRPEHLVAQVRAALAAAA